MRRALALVLAMTLALALSACGGGNDRVRTEEFLTRAQGAASISLEAELTALSGEKVLEYTLSCGYTDHEAQVSVLAPESLAGITATVSGQELDLSYQGAALETQLLTEGGIAPVSVLPQMLSALETGHLDRLGKGDWEGTPCITAELLVEDSLTVALWLEEESLTPLYGELWENGSRSAWWTVTAWELIPGTEADT
jgi:hypothetical protein